MADTHETVRRAAHLLTGNAKDYDPYAEQNARLAKNAEEYYRSIW